MAAESFLCLFLLTIILVLLKSSLEGLGGDSKPRLNDQTISSNIVLEENFLHSYPTFSITNNFFWSFSHPMSCKANTVLPKICG